MILNRGISSESIAVYCALRSFMKRDQDYYGITEAQIYYYLTAKALHSQYLRQIIRSGLNELVSSGVIAVELPLGASDRILNLSALHITENSKKKFTAIELSEIQTILNGCGVNKYSVLRYFISLIGTFNPKLTVALSEFDQASRILSTMPIEYLCKLTGLSRTTIFTYNKILEELQLIYIYHAADYYHTDAHTIKSPPNVYGRYRDKEYVNQYVKNDAQYRGYGNYDSDSKAKANHKRRLAQRYNQIVSGRQDYSREEIQEVYDYITAHNESYQKLYEKSKYDPYKEKIRDVSILEEILTRIDNNIKI